MIIVLSGADFSDNNIGHVEFNNPLDPQVKSIMEHYTRFPANEKNAYAQALNTLYSDLKNAGLWDKLAVLSLPFMASGIDECGYNAIGKAGYDGITGIFSLNESNEIYRSGEMTTADTTGGFPISLPSNKMSFFGIVNDNGSEAGQIISASIAGYYYSKNNLNFLNTPMGQVYENGVAVTQSGMVEAFLQGFAITKTPFVLSYNNGTVYYLDNRVEREGSAQDAEEATMTRFYPLVTTTGAANSEASMKLFGCGQNLTLEEVEDLYSILDKFDKATTP